MAEPREVAEDATAEPVFWGKKWHEGRDPGHLDPSVPWNWETSENFLGNSLELPGHQR